MKRLVRYALVGAVLAGAGAAAAQDILFFERPDFAGRRFGATQAISNLADQGFNDRASSVVVSNGTWQLCADAYFRGRCVTLPPGEYRNLAQIGLANEVSSARELGIVPGGPGPGPGPGGRGRSVTLYEDFGFGGRAMEVDGEIVNLGRTNFNDRARSLIVHGGMWELCRDDGFSGGCQTFGPGRHENLGYLAGQASSIRPIGGPGGPGGPGRPGDWGSGGRVVLYEQPGFGGRRVALNQEFLPNFDGTGFNDRASSLRVESGYWMFCSDAGFRGTCRTFGPGDYPNLPPGLNNQISSGRRIHNEYPYNSSPNWGGYTQQ